MTEPIAPLEPINQPKVDDVRRHQVKAAVSKAESEMFHRHAAELKVPLSIRIRQLLLADIEAQKRIEAHMRGAQ